MRRLPTKWFQITQPADPKRGEAVYSAKCAVCPGVDGEGKEGANGAYLFPALWGPRNRPVIVDLRTALDIEAAPYKIPGARLIDPEELRHPHHTIPRDSEVVFYCAEPREATSARVALRAAQIGFHNVHPLSGGLEA